MTKIGESKQSPRLSQVTLINNRNGIRLKTTFGVEYKDGKGLKRNADGSVDLFFGSKAPKGQETNWIETSTGKYWMAWFRFYGPEKTLFDKSWKMPDVEKM